MLWRRLRLDQPLAVVGAGQIKANTRMIDCRRTALGPLFESVETKEVAN